jgi:hypothetical protein
LRLSAPHDQERHRPRRHGHGRGCLGRPHGQHDDRRRKGGVHGRDDGWRVDQEPAPRPQAAASEPGEQIAGGKAPLIVVVARGEAGLQGAGAIRR